MRIDSLQPLDTQSAAALSNAAAIDDRVFAPLMRRTKSLFASSTIIALTPPTIFGYNIYSYRLYGYAVVAGMDDKDERKAIDKAMRGLWELAQSEKIVIFLAVHLKRIEGKKGHEDGMQTSLSHLPGSQSNASNSNLMLGLKRDRQGHNPNLCTIRVLKNRFTGETGVASQLECDRPTDRLLDARSVSPFTPAKVAPNTDF